MQKFARPLKNLLFDLALILWCKNFCTGVYFTGYWRDFSPTFLPAPHGDGVFRLHSYRQQQLPRGAEVNVADASAVRTAEDGQSLFTHGVPHVDGRCGACRVGEDTKWGSLLLPRRQTVTSARIKATRGNSRAVWGISAANTLRTRAALTPFNVTLVVWKCFTRPPCDFQIHFPHLPERRWLQLSYKYTKQSLNWLVRLVWMLLVSRPE